MAIIAACEHMVRARERYRHLQRVEVEVDRILVDPFQIFARRTLDIFPAFFERAISSIQPLRQVWNRTAQMRQNPGDLRELLGDPGKYQLRCGECRVEYKPDERH